MEIFEAFVQYLNSYTPLTSIIGSNGVFPDVLPQGRENGVVYTPIPSKPNYHFNGQSTLKNSAYQFATYSKKEFHANKEAYAIQETLVNAFDNIKGIYGGLNIQFVKCTAKDIKMYEPDTGLHSYKCEFIFYFNKE